MQVCFMRIAAYTRHLDQPVPEWPNNFHTSLGFFLLRTFRFYLSHAVQWHLTSLSAIYILKHQHVLLSKSSQMQFCMKDHSNSWRSSRWTERHCANGDKPFLLMMIVPRRRAYWHLTACIAGARWCA